MTTTSNSADDDKAKRIWDRLITGIVLVGEYDDGDVILYNFGADPLWRNLLLEPHQIRELLAFAFAENRAEQGRISLGSNYFNDDVVVEYKDGSYIIETDLREIILTNQQMTDICVAMDDLSYRYLE